MTRILLSVLAVIEAVLGMFALVTTLNLYFTHGAGMSATFLPVLAVAILLLVAGAAVFIRKPWSLWVHIVVVWAIGTLFALFVGPLLGADPAATMIVSGGLAVLMTVVFLLPPVRRYFGLAPAAQH
jgi:hypothetical protein